MKYEDDPIPVSVAVPTYNREEVLCDTLRQLLRQDYSNYEIIVADQSKSHIEETREFLNSVHDRIRYFRLDKVNLPYARNFCIKKAKGEIVLFVDDDIKIENDFVYQHAINYRNPEVQAVVGKVLDENHPCPTEARPYLFSFFGRAFMRLNSNRGGYVWGGRTCNVSFTKEVFKKIGYFDENYIDYTHGLAQREDTEIFLRMRRSSMRVLFEPKAQIYHLLSLTGGAAPLKLDETKTKRNSSLNKDIYVCETIFHLKYYKLYTLPFLVIFLILNFVIRKNFPDVKLMLKSSKVMIRGLIKGLKYKYEGIK